MLKNVVQDVTKRNYQINLSISEIFAKIVQIKGKDK